MGRYGGRHVGRLALHALMRSVGEFPGRSDNGATRKPTCQNTPMTTNTLPTRMQVTIISTVITNPRLVTADGPSSSR